MLHEAIIGRGFTAFARRLIEVECVLLHVWAVECHEDIGDLDLPPCVLAGNMLGNRQPALHVLTLMPDGKFSQRHRVIIVAALRADRLMIEAGALFGGCRVFSQQQLGRHVAAIPHDIAETGERGGERIHVRALQFLEQANGTSRTGLGQRMQDFLGKRNALRIRRVVVDEEAGEAQAGIHGHAFAGHLDAALGIVDSALFEVLLEFEQCCLDGCAATHFRAFCPEAKDLIGITGPLQIALIEGQGARSTV